MKTRSFAAVAPLSAAPRQARAHRLVVVDAAAGADRDRIGQFGPRVHAEVPVPQPDVVGRLSVQPRLLQRHLPLYFGEGLADGKRPYLDAHADQQTAARTGEVEYPVMIGAAMEVGACSPSILYPRIERGQGFVDITWVMLTIAAVITVIATALTVRRRIWDAAMFAAAPSLILAGAHQLGPARGRDDVARRCWRGRENATSSPARCSAWRSRRSSIRSCFSYRCSCCAWRARQFRAFWVAFGGAAIRVGGCRRPVVITRIRRLVAGSTTSARRAAPTGVRSGTCSRVRKRSAVRFGLNYTTNHSTCTRRLYRRSPSWACAGSRWPPARRPRLPQLCFLTLALFLVLNKVYSPQYVLWLLPFAVLARPRWRAFLVWQAAEIIYFLGIWMYLLGDPSGRTGKGLEFGAYAIALAIRDVSVLALCALVVVDILRPEARHRAGRRQ